jgi:hypothetical protein
MVAAGLLSRSRLDLGKTAQRLVRRSGSHQVLERDPGLMVAAGLLSRSRLDLGKTAHRSASFLRGALDPAHFPRLEGMRLYQQILLVLSTDRRLLV